MKTIAITLNDVIGIDDYDDDDGGDDDDDDDDDDANVN